MTRSFSSSVVFGLGVLLSFSVVANDSAVKSSRNPANVAIANVHQANGKVIALADGKVTLKHEPIASLNWPAMEMSFALADADVARDIAVGDSVHFIVVQRDNQFIVTHLSKRTP